MVHRHALVLPQQSAGARLGQEPALGHPNVGEDEQEVGHAASFSASSAFSQTVPMTVHVAALRLWRPPLISPFSQISPGVLAVHSPRGSILAHIPPDCCENCP